MKVDLEKLELGISPLTGNIYAGVKEKNKPHAWRHKKDITEQFRALEEWREKNLKAIKPTVK